MQEVFQSRVRALRCVTCYIAGHGAGKPPASLPGGLGTSFPGRCPSAQPMVLTSPAERWEGASVWPPTISLLLGSSSTKGLQISAKKYLVCVHVSSGDTLSPRHCGTVIGCCSVEHLVPSMCLSQSDAKEMPGFGCHPHKPPLGILGFYPRKKTL